MQYVVVDAVHTSCYSIILMLPAEYMVGSIIHGEVWFAIQFTFFFLFVYLFAYLFVYETTVNKQTKFTFLLQAILYEIDAWFRQLNQNITTDCSSDCTPFYTNMHILL